MTLKHRAVSLQKLSFQDVPVELWKPWKITSVIESHGQVMENIVNPLNFYNCTKILTICKTDVSLCVDFSSFRSFKRMSNL